MFVSHEMPRDRSGWSDAALCADVVELAGAVERAQAELVAAVGQWQARAAWTEDGAHSGLAWLVANTPMTRAAASRLCATARLVHGHEQTAKALDVGDVTVAHVEVLATAARRREGLYPEYEDTLLDAARTMNPDDLVMVARRWRELADDQLAALDAATAFENRYLHVSPTTGGARIDGFLDPVGAATVIDALDALSPPDPVSGPAPRSLSARYADAFVMMAEASLDAEERDGRAQPHIGLVWDAQTLFDRASVDVSTARCDLEGYGPIGRAVAERMACDAKVARIVMAGKSRVLDLGRSTRVVSPALRTAVTVRDRHCQGRGCRTPAKWCDVHHVVHWLDGGETKEENLILLCRRCHVQHHEGGWRISREPDGTVTSERVHRQRLARRRPARARDGP